MAAIVRSLRAALVAAAIGAGFAGSAGAQDVCGAKDPRLECSMQCCGRRSCPPSCEVDCVKACVDACNAPAQQQAYRSIMRQLQLRCGNKAVR